MKEYPIWTTGDSRTISLNEGDTDGRYVNTWSYARTAPKEPMVGITDFIYNESKGISTLLTRDGEATTVKLANGATHCPYTAFTALVAKYVLGSQAAIVKHVDAIRVIKPINPAPTNESAIFMPDWDTMMNILADMEVDD